VEFELRWMRREVGLMMILAGSGHEWRREEKGFGKQRERERGRG